MFYIFKNESVMYTFSIEVKLDNFLGGMWNRFDSILPPNLMRLISQEFLYPEQFVNVFSILSLPCVLLYDLMTSILTIAYKSKEL